MVKRYNTGMKVFYEGTALFKNKNIPQAGIAHYVYNIFLELKKLDKQNSYEVFGLNFFGKPQEFKENFPKGTIFHLIKYIPGKVWNVSNRLLALPPLELLLGKKADVFIFTQFRLYPTLLAKKRFVMIHDIAFEHFPQFIEKKNLQYLKRRVPEAARKSDVIITISQATRNDLITTYDVSPEKIVVAPCAVDTKRHKPTKLTPEVINKYNLPQKYVLYLGTIEPRKNLTRLVDAYHELPQALKNEYPLVLAGGKGWNDGPILRAIERARKSARVIQTGYVDEADIPALYTGAEVFLYPSNYEGFGMQILEAMACNTPVLTGKNSSLPEVGGNAAYYVNEKKVHEISKGIAKLLTDKKLRLEMIKQGKVQITKFSWHDSAETIIELINTPSF